MGARRSIRCSLARRAYTLVEVLIVVAILGIAGALVIPSMGQVGVLRVQAAVRSVVADITFAQSDAVAFQQQRAVMFFPESNRWNVVEVAGDELNPDTDTITTTTINGAQFGDSVISSVDFEGATNLIFDELGGPVTAPGGNTPSNGGTVVILGSGQTFTIAVEAYTGRVTVARDGG